jgi:predicted O-methyltransferase YrrM
VIRNQTAHETLIPALVEAIGARNYLEFGTHLNQTISNVRCPLRYGVDRVTVPLYGAEMFNMSTEEFIANVAHLYAPYDFVFIDADHCLNSVRRDFFGIVDYVSAEGIICLHDTNPETVADTAPGFCGDSWRFAEILHNDGYEAVTLPYHPGLTIVRNRKAWGPR